MKHPLFWWGFALLIWLAILLAPPLNLLFRVQLRGSSAIRFSVLPAQDVAPNFWELSARRYPGDLNILMQAAQESPFAAASNEHPFVRSQVFPEKEQINSPLGVLRRLDFLLQKFPNNKTLLALRLHTAFSNMSGGRTGGEFSDGNFYNNQTAGKTSPEVTKDPPTYTTADLQRAIVLASRGQKLEQDNGYFDWMKACFLMYAWRDKEAYVALDAAASKKRFDDHALDIGQAKLQARSTALNRPLLLEEKLEAQMSTLYPTYARYREMARILSWQSLKAQRRGDHAQALRIAAGLSRTAMHMRENSNNYIAGLVAVAIEAIARNGPVADTRRQIGGRISPKQLINLFSTYATKNGRADLAAKANQSGIASTSFRKSVQTSMQGFYGVPIVALLGAQLLWQLGVAILLMLPLAFLLLVLKPILSCVPRMRGVLRWRHSQPHEIPSAREVWSGALACGGARAFATLIGGVTVVALCALGLYIGAGKGSEAFDNISTTWNSIGSDNLIGFYNLSDPNSPSPAQWRFVFAFTPLLFGGLFCAWRAAQWQQRQNGETNFSFFTFFKTAFESKTFKPSAISNKSDGFDVGGAVMKLVNFVISAMLAAAWLVFAFAQGSDESVAWLLPLFFVLLFSGALLFEIFADWRKRPHRTATARHGLRLFHRSLTAWLVLGSALYLLMLLVSLPLRASIETQLDRVIAQGEVRATAK